MKPSIRIKQKRSSPLLMVLVGVVFMQILNPRALAQCAAGCLARIAELERSIASDEATLRSLAGSGTQVIVGDGSGPGLADSYRKSIAAKRNAIQLYRQQHARCGASGPGLGGTGSNPGYGNGFPIPSTGNADQAARMVETVGGLIGIFQQLQDQKDRAQEAREERDKIIRDARDAANRLIDQAQADAKKTADLRWHLLPAGLSTSHPVPSTP